MVVTADSDVILVTGATGLVGGCFAQQALGRKFRVRAFCRPDADTSLLTAAGAEIIAGDLLDVESLKTACDGVSVVVHCAARVGDWGPTREYRVINVDGTRHLLDAALAAGTLTRWIQLSSLGVYSGMDHYGTDETSQPNRDGIDGYTLTKVESEELVCRYIREHQLPAVILRPGFIYGPRDRTVMPRLLDKLRTGRFAYLGNHDKLMNNTFVGNLCEAIWLALEHDEIIGEIFNIRDPRSVSKKEFIDTICQAAGISIPTRVVPLHIARFLSWHMELIWKLFRKKSAPLVNSARIKFLGRNLDFSIEKAMRDLGYQPTADFRDAMPETVKSFETSDV